jgi:hypothetical protein
VEIAAFALGRTSERLTTIDAEGSLRLGIGGFSFEALWGRDRPDLLVQKK